jgi:hypothetical protein
MDSRIPARAEETVAVEFTSGNRSAWEQPDLWRSVCAELTIQATDSNTSKLVTAPHATEEAVALGKVRRRRLIERGYALVDEPVATSLVPVLRQGIETLHKLNLPASFILLFDETWELASMSRSVLKVSTLDKNEFQFDILAWYIDSGGFSPHRDRQPEDAPSSFEAEEAKFVTQWIALTDATPENSCLYVIPKGSDPGYTEGDTEEEDPLQKALPNKQAFQQIRALPRQQGQSVLFTHRIIHWGSERDPTTSEPPRIAISFVCSDPSFERLYVDPSYFTSEKLPPFHIRMLLVCAQLLIYHQRFDLSKECIKACYEYCKDHEEELEESYRQKVFVEFVKAMSETPQAATKKSASGKSALNELSSNAVAKESSAESEENEEEEAMMQEMLDAETGGYGDFADDYDEIANEGGADDILGDDGTSDYDEDDDDNEDGAGLFGKRLAPNEEETTKGKRVKPSSF